MSRDPNTIAPQISQAAAEWFLIMRESAVSDVDRVGFSDWLRASPVHVRAYLDVTRLWGDVAQLDPALEIQLDLDGMADNVVPLPEHGRRHEVATTFHPAPVSQRRKNDRELAVVASIAVIIGLLGVSWWQVERSPTYTTDVGEQRVITLDDGSIVRLNARTEVKVRMASEQRLIELVDGQALFEVAKEPGRPFLVQSGSVVTRAVGTQFDVYRKPTGTVITVVEGKVEVRMTQKAGIRGAATEKLALPISVSAGEQVIVGRGGSIEQHRDANVNAATRWLQHELVFEGQPLRAVVEEFNRYQRVPIILEDPVLGELRVNAVFNTTGPEPLLLFIGRMEDVQVERTPRAIRIVRR